jgi:hypothetical protein
MARNRATDRDLFKREQAQLQLEQDDRTRRQDLVEVVQLNAVEAHEAQRTLGVLQTARKHAVQAGLAGTSLAESSRAETSGTTIHAPTHVSAPAYDDTSLPDETDPKEPGTDILRLEAAAADTVNASATDTVTATTADNVTAGTASADTAHATSCLQPDEEVPNEGSMILFPERDRDPDRCLPGLIYLPYRFLFLPFDWESMVCIDGPGMDV